jgi:hypothetical protein
MIDDLKEEKGVHGHRVVSGLVVTGQRQLVLQQLRKTQGPPNAAQVIQVS